MVVGNSVFWGKFDKQNSLLLPLSAHCLDVGLVFQGLCVLRGVRRALENICINRLTEQQIARLAVLAALHDIGKAGLGFQKKNCIESYSGVGHVREMAPLLMPDDELCQQFEQCLPPDFLEWFSDAESAYGYLLASLSHHGKPIYFSEGKNDLYFASRKWWLPRGKSDPMDAIRDVVNWVKHGFPEAFVSGGETLPSKPQFQHRFSGLVMLADWLGSHQAWFPVKMTTVEERLCLGRDVVPKLLKSIGMDVDALRPLLFQVPDEFRSRFGYLPYPAQAAVDVLNVQDKNTNLLIVESETGSGKTETAINWFLKLFKDGEVDGLYFALPTRVAAREVYKRVDGIIKRLFPDADKRPITVLAVPGYARLDGLPPLHLMPSDVDGYRWQDDEDLRIRDRQWAVERPKRFLAATVAIGTIDQALLSVIQTSHAHLRSVCLDRSLLVVDEVHASDYYMSRLLEHLIDNHLAAGGRAMLLSATLGSISRSRYTRSNRQAPELTAAVTAPYPALSLADGSIHGLRFSGSYKEIQVEILHWAFSPERVVERLVDSLAEGARVLVIMNTVGRAIALLKSVEQHRNMSPEWLFTCCGVVCPHHGRFAPADRELLDATVSRRLGPDSLPGPVLLIGTQTLEQSLDIDADIIVTDLAPADVLLQRLGRLHRHKRKRPHQYASAKCLLLTPDCGLESGLNNKGQVDGTWKSLGYGSVYEDMRALEMTRRVLSANLKITIPHDNRRLVETVTHPESLMLFERESTSWIHHAQSLEGQILADKLVAGHAIMPFERYFGDFIFNDLGGRATTRLGVNNLHLSLSRSVTGPFGQPVSEIVVPGHMVPSQTDDVVRVENEEEGVSILSFNNKRYRYSRYGLEEVYV